MKIFSLPFVLVFFLPVAIVISCKKNDETDPCADFEKLGTKILVDGISQELSIAQLVISSAFGTTYSMQIAAITSDCNEYFVLSISVEEGDNQKLNGTYQIKDFFDAGENDAYGSFTKQKVSPTSQSTTDLNSGTLKVIDLTNKKYNIDLSAKLVGGGTVTFKGDVQF